MAAWSRTPMTAKSTPIRQRGSSRKRPFQLACMASRLRGK
jgi:hypothetical protein